MPQPASGGDDHRQHARLVWLHGDGAGIHDVIGTRCDRSTNQLLNKVDNHHCCHSNLTRRLSDATVLLAREAEAHVHVMLNVFMETGFSSPGSDATVP